MRRGAAAVRDLPLVFLRNAGLSIVRTLEETRSLRSEAAQVQFQSRGGASTQRRDAIHVWMEQKTARLTAKAARLRAVLQAAIPAVSVPAAPDLPTDLDSELHPVRNSNSCQSRTER